jgi:hypothetical protein
MLRVTNKLGQHSFIALNQPVDGGEINPVLAGRPFIKNSIAQAKVDIVIDEEAFTATIRESLANQMFEMIGKLPPEVGLLMLDDVIDLLDLPNKDQLRIKIQQAQGMMQDKMQQEQANQRMVAEATRQKANTNVEKGQGVDRSKEEAAMAQGVA